jgi:hypothetical protein
MVCVHLKNSHPRRADRRIPISIGRTWTTEYGTLTVLDASGQALAGFAEDEWTCVHVKYEKARKS